MALEGLKLKAAQRRQKKYDDAVALAAVLRARGEEIGYSLECDLATRREDEYEAYREQAARERKALAARRKAERSLLRDKTCQVCGRDILANTGVIAHHGYERPGDGWQTSSCFGARYQPYEQAHDRLDAALSHARGMLRDAEAHLESLRTAPPASLSFERRVPGSKHIGYDLRRATYVYPMETVTVARPEDFSEATISDYRYTPEGMRSYQDLLRSARMGAERRVNGLKGDVSFLSARRKAWKAPAA